jgi:hypothetical protein
MGTKVLGTAASNVSDAVRKSELDAAILALKDSPLGMVYNVDPRIAVGQAVWSGANRCIFTRVTEGGVTISKIAIDVLTASGNISVAVYQNSGAGRAAVPGTRLATSGAVACPATGYREVALGSSVRVEKGDWLAMSCDNVTASFTRLIHPTGSDITLGLIRRQDTAHPAPSPVGTLAASTYMPILIGVP